MFIPWWGIVLWIYAAITAGVEIGKSVAIERLASGYKESLKELEEAKKKIAAKKAYDEVMKGKV